MIRIGIIGAGPNAAGHARYFTASPRSQVVAIADPDQRRAVQLAEEVQTEHIADYRDFIDRVDAVVISSPNFLHKEHAIACAQAGKHIYCEKPLGISLDEAREIVAAVDQAGVKSFVGFSVRFDPAIQTIQRLLAEENAGSMLSLCSRRLAYFPPETANGWRGNPRLSGGLLLEVSIHEVEWMLALAGSEVNSVYARSVSPRSSDSRGNDHLWITLNFANGAVGLHEGSWISPTPTYFRSVQSTELGWQTDEWGTMVYQARIGQNREEMPLAQAFDRHGHFLDCIEDGVQSTSDVHWGLKVMATCEAILESAASGKPVDVWHA